MKAAAVRGGRFSRAGLAAARILALAALLAAPARAQVFMTQGEALGLAFPGAHVQPMAVVLTPEQKTAVEKRARVRTTTALVTGYVATRNDSLIGIAFFDRRTVRTMPGVFMTVVAPDSTVARVDVLAFHEPPDYQPPQRWLDRFRRRPLDDRLWPNRDLRNLSGATLSARAVTESARLALALYQVVYAQDLAARRP
jgi:hypothetical protein